VQLLHLKQLHAEGQEGAGRERERERESERETATEKEEARKITRERERAQIYVPRWTVTVRLTYIAPVYYRPRTGAAANLCPFFIGCLDILGQS
jgi:hypothetical protein